MIFKWGSYAHDPDTTMVRVSVQGIFDKFNRRMGDDIEYTIIGWLEGTPDADPEVTRASLTTKIEAFKTAYNSDYEDFGLYLDDGTTATAHTVLNSETFGGTKVMSYGFTNGPWTGRIEYLNRRTFYVVLRAQIRVGSGLYSWKERLTIRGTGAAKWRYSPKISGAPDAQTLQTHTSFWYVQEGQAVGREDWPAPADPLFPSIEHGEMRVRTFETADDIVVDNAEMYGTTWQYFMEATTDQGFSAFIQPEPTGGFS